MKRLTLLGALLLAPLALADYEQAMSAWETRDYNTAFQEFSQLAREGDPYAMYMLGRLYAQGQGTVQDYVQAHKWFNLAASRDHRHAPDARRTLTGRMTAEQIAEAQQLARNWQPGQEATPARPEPAPDNQLGRDRIAELQGLLNDLGYEAGPVDGLLGAGTRSAIRAYQRDRGMVATGTPDQGLLVQLRQQHQEQQVRQGQRVSGDPADRQPSPVPDSETGWSTLVVDGFADGDFTRDPAWEVTAGDFRVEQGALRTRVLPDRTQAREMQPEDLPLAILGTILDRAGGGPPRDSAAPSAQTPRYAEIHLQQPLPGAFELEVRLTVNQGGRLAIGPYRQGQGSGGYRLVYTQGGARSLELVRLEGQGGQVLGAYSRSLGLEDGRQHTLNLTRRSDGTLTVAVDGEPLISAAGEPLDRGFAGLSLVNQGGDYSIDRVQLRAPR